MFGQQPGKLRLLCLFLSPALAPARTNNRSIRFMALSSRVMRQGRRWCRRRDHASNGYDLLGAHHPGEYSRLGVWCKRNSAKKRTGETDNGAAKPARFACASRQRAIRQRTPAPRYVSYLTPGGFAEQLLVAPRAMGLFDRGGQVGKGPVWNRPVRRPIR